jgi:hypothetical protein
VAQIGDGLVGLPYDAATKESLEWVANAIEEANGHATIWIATPTARQFGRDLATDLIEQRAAEYRQLIERASELETTEPSTRAIRTLRAELRRIERRDYFPPSDRSAAREIVRHLESEFKATIS